MLHRNVFKMYITTYNDSANKICERKYSCKLQIYVRLKEKDFPYTISIIVLVFIPNEVRPVNNELSFQLDIISALYFFRGLKPE